MGMAMGRLRLRLRPRQQQVIVSPAAISVGSLPGDAADCGDGGRDGGDGGSGWRRECGCDRWLMTTRVRTMLILRRVRRMRFISGMGRAMGRMKRRW